MSINVKQRFANLVEPVAFPVLPRDFGQFFMVIPHSVEALRFKRRSYDAMIMDLTHGGALPKMGHILSSSGHFIFLQQLSCSWNGLIALTICPFLVFHQYPL
jgi:hypothetical protein